MNNEKNTKTVGFKNMTDAPCLCHFHSMKQSLQHPLCYNFNLFLMGLRLQCSNRQKKKKSRIQLTLLIHIDKSRYFSNQSLTMPSSCQQHTLQITSGSCMFIRKLEMSHSRCRYLARSTLYSNFLHVHHCRTKQSSISK